MTTTQKLEWARVARAFFILLWALGMASIAAHWYNPGFSGALFVGAGLAMSTNTIQHYRKQVDTDA
jgi:hypothetical protein